MKRSFAKRPPGGFAQKGRLRRYRCAARFIYFLCKAAAAYSTKLAMAIGRIEYQRKQLLNADPKTASINSRPLLANDPEIAGVPSRLVNDLKSDD
jgi:hypothetical protein